MANHLLTSVVAVLAGVATGQPQMCKEYLGEVPCLDAGCRWATMGPASGTCTRQCHEFGGAAAAGTAETQATCVSDAIGCRWIQHPKNPGLGKCGKLCAEFEIESNCMLAGYSTCRWANSDVTAGAAICSKQCNTITDADWCTRVHCVWEPAAGRCRRKCIEFKMKAPCESIGCEWVTPADGYQISQCIAPGVRPPCATAAATTLVNQTGTNCTMANVSAKGTQFLEPVKKH